MVAHPERLPKRVAKSANDGDFQKDIFIILNLAISGALLSDAPAIGDVRIKMRWIIAAECEFQSGWVVIFGEEWDAEPKIGVNLQDFALSPLSFVVGGLLTHGYSLYFTQSN